MRPAAVFDVARRDLRGSLKSFIILYACLALGVAAICAVGLLNYSVTHALDRDARILLGGDIAVDVASQALEASELEAIVPDGAIVSKTANTNSIAFASNERRVPVSIKAVDELYPLLGEILTGKGRSDSLQLASDEVLVDPTLLPRLGVNLGETITIGQADFTVKDTVLSEPDRIGGVIGVGPRALLSTAGLERAAILLPGSLVRYYYRLILPDGESSAAFEDRVEGQNPERRWRVRDAEGLQPRLRA
ncbi:MAG: ABC transporter permease [Pseudomonadota bacterium]